jgi:sugar lactone lactonase YvrE
MQSNPRPSNAASRFGILVSMLSACGSGDILADATTPSSLTLPGNAYYPENLYAAPDGTLYVGSLGTGEVVKFAPGSTTPAPFIAAGDPKGVSGVYVSGSALWLCAVDLSTNPPTTEVRSYDLTTGAKTASYPFSQPAFCNDLLIDPASNLFVTDSFGAVWKLAKGSGTLAVWSNDSKLAPPTASGFGADGIALDGAGNLWVSNFSAGQLLRIPINADGTAGAAVPLTITPSLGTPDGMRWLGTNMIVLADGQAGDVTQVVISGATGTATAIGTGLNGPTSIIKVGSTYWVTEGQIGHLTGAITGPPITPFDVRTFAAR